MHEDDSKEFSGEIVESLCFHILNKISGVGEGQLLAGCCLALMTTSIEKTTEPH